jgi:RecB family exonuclease
VPFTLTIGNYLLEGAIDRIEQDNDGKWRVIDIKTNSAAEAKVEQLKEKYSLQMQVYSFVVGKLLGNVAMSELHFINCASNGDSVLIEPIPPIPLKEAEKKLLGLMDRVSTYVEQVRM